MARQCSSQQASPAHSYSASGTYTVTLTVTDNSGKTASATTTATISDTILGKMSYARQQGLGGAFLFRTRKPSSALFNHD